MRGKPWHRRIEFRKKGFFVRNARPFVNVKSHFPPSEKRERKMVFPCSGPQFENCETTLRVAFLPFPVPFSRGMSAATCFGIRSREEGFWLSGWVLASFAAQVPF